MGQGPKIDLEGYGDALLYFGLAAIMVVLTAFTYWFTKQNNNKSDDDGVGGVGVERRNERQQGDQNRRQAAGRRNRGRRVGKNQVNEENVLIYVD